MLIEISQIGREDNAIITFFAREPMPLIMKLLHNCVDIPLNLADTRTIINLVQPLHIHAEIRSALDRTP
jgi:hypothetical protein